MSDKEEFEKFIVHGIEGEISLKNCIETGIAFFLPFLLFSVAIELETERRNYVFWALGILPLLFYFVSAIRLKKGKGIGGVHYILYNGITAGCISFLFGVIGFDILLYLFGGKERIIMICIAGAGYIFEIILLGCVINLQVKKRKYSQQKGIAGSVFVSAVCPVLGATLARTFLKDVDNGTAMGILCMCSFFVSYLPLIGTVNLFKYQYIVKHPKILAGKTSVTKK